MTRTNPDVRKGHHMSRNTDGKLASERVIYSAPMSFAGSAQRLRRWIRNTWAFWTGGLLILLLWWAVIACWYVVFGVLLVPYRLIRRGNRKRKAEELRHREMLDRLDARDSERGTPGSEVQAAD